MANRETVKTVGDLRRYLEDLDDNTPILRNVEGFLHRGIEVDLDCFVAYPHPHPYAKAEILLPQHHGYSILPEDKGDKFVGVVVRPLAQR